MRQEAWRDVHLQFPEDTREQQAAPSFSGLADPVQQETRVLGGEQALLRFGDKAPEERCVVEVAQHRTVFNPQPLHGMLPLTGLEREIAENGRTSVRGKMRVSDSPKLFFPSYEAYKTRARSTIWSSPEPTSGCDHL